MIQGAHNTAKMMSAAQGKGSVVWRQPFGPPLDPTTTTTAPPTTTTFSKQTTSHSTPYLLTYSPESLSIYGILSKRHSLLRHLSMASLRGYLGKGKQVVVLRGAWMFGDLVVACLGMAGGQENMDVVMTFGLFEEKCRVVGEVDGVVNVAVCGGTLFVLSATGKLSVFSDTATTYHYSVPILEPSIVTVHLHNEEYLVAIGGKSGQWCLLQHHKGDFEDVGVFGSDTNQSPVTDLVINPTSDGVDLFTVTGRCVYLQRFRGDGQDLVPVEAREILALKNGQCRRIGLFKSGAKPGALPVVVAVDTDGAVEFRVIVIHTNDTGLLCEDLGVDLFDGDLIRDFMVNEGTLECFVLSGDCVNVYGGLTLRNAWLVPLQSPQIPEMQILSTFDFAKWFNLFGPFPYDPATFKQAHFDEYSTQLPLYPPSNWSDLRALVDDITSTNKYGQPVLLLYYILLDHDQKTACKFAWEFGMTPEECRVVRRARSECGVLGVNVRPTLADSIDKFGVAVALSQSSSVEEVKQIVDLVIITGKEWMKKEFLDYPFDASTLDTILEHLRSIPNNKPMASELLLSLLFYHSKLTELLETADNIPVKSEVVQSMLDNVSMMVGMGTATVPFLPDRLRLRTILPRNAVKEVHVIQKTPIKHNTHKTLSPRKPITRQFSPVPLVTASPVQQTHDPVNASSGLTRQPSIVTLLAPRHHAALTPSRLGAAVISEASSLSSDMESVEDLIGAETVIDAPTESPQSTKPDTPTKTKGKEKPNSRDTPKDKDIPSRQDKQTAKDTLSKRRSRSMSPKRTPKRTRTAATSVSPRSSPQRPQTRTATPTSSPHRRVEIDLSLPPHSPHHPPIVLEERDSEEDVPLAVTLRNRANSIKEKKRKSKETPSIRHSPRLSRKRQ